MRKWLHRGAIALLLLIAASAGAASVFHVGFGNPEFMRVSRDAPAAHSVLVSHNALLFWRSHFYEVTGDWPDDRFLDLRVCQISRIMPYAYSNSDPPWCIQWDVLRMPLWSIGLFAVSYPAFFFWRYCRRQRRRPANGCARCDYDLTGNETGVCPECGKPVEATA